MSTYFKRHAATVTACTVAAMLLASAAFAQSGHDHMHMGMDHGGAAAPAEVPPLKILMPETAISSDRGLPSSSRPLPISAR